jgi:hypothetical protein
MKTFNQLATRAYSFAGKPNDGGEAMTNIKADLVTGLSLFKNAARRYWTRKEANAPLQQGQKDYQMPADFVRVSEIKISLNGIDYPLEEVQSEHKWNQLNVIPSVTIYIPTKYFVKGNNVISIWPAPATTDGTIDVVYEPRVPDFSLPDVTGTATVTNSATTVTDSATSFTPDMVGKYFTVTDGSDGNWYQIGGYTSNTTIALGNFYQGATGAGKAYLIGACPDIPEDYHMGLAYYAAAQFYLVRKDSGQSQLYLGMFQQLLDQYIETYAAKSTGIVQSRPAAEVYSVFGIPPTNIAG